MSSVITLRARLVAGCALALVALTGCAGTVTDSQALTGTDAGLITSPATGDPDALPDLADLASQLDDAASTVPTQPTAGHVVQVDTPAAPVAASSLEPAEPAPVAAPVEPAPVVAETPAPADPGCSAAEEWDPTIPACVAHQAPEEQTGGARCPDPLQVVVAILEDGSLVCGPADDTVEG